MTIESAVPVIKILICIPPALSFLYTLSILIFLASWNECSWNALTSPLLLRAGVLMAAISITCLDGSSPVSAILIFITSAVVSILHIIKSYKQYVQGPCPNLRPACAKGRVILITGANTGIGYETARQLIELGATVIIACRNRKRAEDAASSLPSSPGCVIILEMDLSSFASVRHAVATFQKMKLPLHCLINNAGVMMGDRRLTTDGYEMTMQCNHLGHFLLTNLLLPSLRQSGDNARIITVTSSTYTLAASAGGLDVNDLNGDRRPHSLFGRYAQSKLANIAFARELARREASLRDGRSSVASHCLHPGLVRTNVVRNMPWYMKLGNDAFGFVLRVLQKTPEAGAYCSVWAALSDELKGESGRYYVNSEERQLWSFAMNNEVEAKLWKVSEQIVGL